MAKQKTTKQTDYIPHGSDIHAGILGLRKATADDALERDGWTLIDMTAFGPQATENYLREVLRQKVSTLKAGNPPIIPNAPKMFDPEHVMAEITKE